MSGILIVDDERIERRGLRSVITKLGYQFELFEAANGREAIAVIEKEDISILLTDISMPVLDGLQLISWVREHEYPIRVLIYSAYGEFEYAQKAIHLSVEDYILKPLDPEQLKAGLDRIIADRERENEEQGRIKTLLLENQSYRENKALSELILRREGSKLSDNTREFAESRLVEGFTVLITLETKKPIVVEKEEKLIQFVLQYERSSFLCLNLSEYREVFFVTYTKAPNEKYLKEFGEFLRHKIEITYQTEAFIMLGMPTADANELASVYSRLERLEEFRFFLKEGIVLLDREGYVAGSRIDEALDGMTSSIYEDIQYKEYSRAAESIRVMVKTLETQNTMSNIYVRHVFIEILGKLAKSATYISADESMTLAKEVLNANDLYAVERIVLDELKHIADIYEKEKKDEGGSDKVIAEIVKIIREDYANPDISIEYLASRVFLTPNYLSSLFKKNRGETINTFLVNYRLERAKQLLLTTKLRVNDIAQLTGFASSSYFVTVFRNSVGIAPAKFRER